MMDVEVDYKKMMEKKKQDDLLAFDKEKKTVAAVKGVDDKGELILYRPKTNTIMNSQAEKQQKR